MARLVRSESFPDSGVTPEDFKDDTPFEQPAQAALAPVPGMIHGVAVLPLVRNKDSRGHLIELSIFEHEREPLVHIYQVLAEPGSVRAWVYHKRQFDRLAYTAGDFEVVLFDLRRDSPTRGMLNVLHVGEAYPSFLRIPPLVVHGVRNKGSEAATFVNMPTRRYDPAHPDKSRLPKNDPRIPYRFDER